MPSTTPIVEVTTVTEELVAAFERLMPQLSATASPPSQSQLAEMVTSKGTIIFVARDETQEDRILGTTTLVLFRVPTGLHARIEDVVVDEAARGRGLGAALIQAALERAQAEGAAEVDLTSRPSREAANRLYQNLGFEQRTTNVYQYRLG